MLHFAEKYDLELKLNKEDPCAVYITEAALACARKGLPFVVTLDECDRLHRSGAGEELTRGKDGEADPPGLKLMKSIFIAFKAESPALLFVTGVLPLLIKELSGPASKVIPLTHRKQYAAAIGLPHEAVERRLREIAEAAYKDHQPAATDTDHKVEKFVKRFFKFMKQYFNGFYFANPVKAGDFAVPMFNSQQVLHFLDWLEQRLLEEAPCDVRKSLHEVKKAVSKASIEEVMDVLDDDLDFGFDTHTQVCGNLPPSALML